MGRSSTLFLCGSTTWSLRLTLSGQTGNYFAERPNTGKMPCNNTLGLHGSLSANVFELGQIAPRYEAPASAAAGLAVVLVDVAPRPALSPSRARRTRASAVPAPVAVAEVAAAEPALALEPLSLLAYVAAAAVGTASFRFHRTGRGAVACCAGRNSRRASSEIASCFGTEGLGDGEGEKCSNGEKRRDLHCLLWECFDFLNRWF